MAEIKVTDKRMFTPDGRLREGVDAEESSAAESAPPPAGPAESAAGGPAAPADRAPEGPGEPPPSGPRLELPGSPPGLAPTFYDLIGVLAEPISLYLGDLALPDGQTAENLEMARLHIDLLDLLRQRTAGNLTVQEKAVLEDLLYRLRLRYVQKRG